MKTIGLALALMALSSAAYAGTTARTSAARSSTSHVATMAPAYMAIGIAAGAAASSNRGEGGGIPMSSSMCGGRGFAVIVCDAYRQKPIQEITGGRWISAFSKCDAQPPLTPEEVVTKFNFDNPEVANVYYQDYGADLMITVCHGPLPEGKKE